ncbi:probable LRR receptor-like serine/threonine-protein kinase At1g07650 [Cynara cardunculus var. scolymus]|uniref:probable LRR receptor-like serine/threonine-protein kinase At1g07650 n=1 Tax=Cynara cardunculus var. scolymus TaxID=59895 RepID=UPI000D62FDCF|nr:probable LRR receptor-like serine/threonine-protein kinase At1g07650 [Cynara cardunculus var. scolymus]
MKTVLFFMFSLIFYSNFAFGQAAKLDQKEVKVLKELGEKLGLAGKKEWNLDKDPCSGEGNWGRGEYRKGFEVSVECDCSFDRNATCHVHRIALKSQNISTAIPPEFSKLRYLKELDLSRNCLNGTIPPQWATMRLVDLSLMGNRLSGPFPRVLTRITTLVNLSMEGNRFSGSLPQEIGNMKSLQKLTLCSNAFTGQLPAALAKLTNLTDLRICDNNFTGKIPDFIGNWTEIGKLHIQGCSLEGPIPSSISALTKLTDLRISDLKGRGSSFPPVQKMEALSKLILRNCFIHGTIPNYIGNMRKMKTLDLSFNNLTGEIPPSFSQLGKTDYIYLTQNNLTGPLPGWIFSSTKTVDVSYNHFTLGTSGPNDCPREGTINMVESYSSSANKQNNIHSCLKKDFPCPNSARQPYSLYINCGGREVNINTATKYQADLEAKGASTYYMGRNWAFSSTGNFLDDDIDSDLYILPNTSSLHNVSTSETRLYTTARTAPISLTYYGLCLINGNYTVRLHFAEIIFSQDNTFNSLGKRVFDVYVQGELKLKDFDIAKEAGGTGRPVIKTFIVNVTSKTVKIQLFWAGKGTTGIPLRGSYGPIISAISVDPNFKPPVYGKKIEVGLIVGTVAGGLFFIFLILLILWRKGYLMGKKAADRELRGLDLQTGIFTLRQIKAATKNFDLSNKLGEGGFGAVYKGLLSDGTIIAVKQLSSKSKQGTREFVNEIGMISALQHPNLVKLYGCCVEGNQLSLIYEYMENNCLSRALFARDKVSKAKLTWPVRWKICLGIARGLVYLHEESQLKIVHRDIKTSNVLLDKDLNAKISDFGLAKLNDDGNTHISTRIAGTIGYMAPEYAMRGYLTPKADVYSFGIVALETVSGKSNTNYRPKEDFVYLLDWAYVLQERGSLLELVDPDLGSEYLPEEAMTMLNVALLCTNASPTLRPTMSQAMNMLEGRTNVQDLLSDPGFSTINPKVKALRNHFWQHPSETLTMSDDPCTESLLSQS